MLYLFFNFRAYREDSRDSRDSRDTEEYFSPREYYPDSFERSFDQDYEDHTPRGYDDITPNYDDPDMTPKGYPDDDFIPRYDSPNGYPSPPSNRYDDYYNRRISSRDNSYEYEDYRSGDFEDQFYDTRSYDQSSQGYDRNSYSDRDYPASSQGYGDSPPRGGYQGYNDDKVTSSRGGGYFDPSATRGYEDTNTPSRGGYTDSPPFHKGMGSFDSPTATRADFPNAYPESPYHPTGRSDTDSEPLYYNSRPPDMSGGNYPRSSGPQSFMNSR